MKIALVTTFNKKLYEYYAHRFIATYCWPFDCYIYHEGWTPKIQYDLPHIKYRDINETNPELKAFIHRNLSRNIDSQYDKDIVPTTDYKMDAIRFCYKICAKTHLMLDCDYDYVFWVDADTYTHADVPMEFVESILPDDCYTAYFGRSNMHSECGFVAYRVNCPEHKMFMNAWESLYRTGALFALPQWHDCAGYDYLRETLGVPSRNLTEVDCMHPIINSEFGKYVDHKKGARKESGSVLSDLHVGREEEYWTRRLSRA